MNLATWSIRDLISSLLLFAMLTLRAVGFRSYPSCDLPDVTLPSVNVTLLQPGAALAQLETDVAR